MSDTRAAAGSAPTSLHPLLSPPPEHGLSHHSADDHDDYYCNGSSSSRCDNHGYAPITPPLHHHHHHHHQHLHHHHTNNTSNNNDSNARLTTSFPVSTGDRPISCGESTSTLSTPRSTPVTAKRTPLDFDKIATSHNNSNTPPLPSPPASLVAQPHKSFRERRHRKNAVSVDSVPRQTIMKALASRPPPTSNMSIAQSISGLLARNNNDTNDTDDSDKPNGLKSPRPAALPRQRRLSEALSQLRLDPECMTVGSKITALASPCFFHKKFDDAVNIDKVLEEIQEDEGMSHSRLVQTATGVREVSKQLQRRPIKIAVKNVMIVTKARDNDLVSLTRELTEWLLATPRNGKDVGVNVYVDAKLRSSRRFDSAGLVGKDERFQSMLRYWTPELCLTTPEKFDLVLTLGGDGTVLYTSWLFQRIVPPILSFSLGSLGFLTNFEFAAYKEQLSRIMGEAGMRVNLRMRFTCTVYRANPNHKADSPESPTHLEAEQFEVLNELVIDRGPSPYVSNLELYGDNALLTVVQADGCIFSTPTGSTAYSLSAGGSLVHPDIPAILLTPICPHTLSFRPMLLNDSMLLRVAIPRHSRATAHCAFDGKGRVELRQGDHVTIAASQYPFPTVLSQPTEWFDSLSRTLRWNTRGAQQKAWGGGTGEGGKDGGGSEREEEEEFDIEIDGDDEAGRDSGYSAATSSAGGNGSPVRRGTATWGF